MSVRLSEYLVNSFSLYKFIVFLLPISHIQNSVSDNQQLAFSFPIQTHPLIVCYAFQQENSPIYPT